LKDAGTHRQETRPLRESAVDTVDLTGGKFKVMIARVKNALQAYHDSFQFLIASCGSSSCEMLRHFVPEHFDIHGSYDTMR
jgi:hypothetical protein